MVTLVQLKWEKLQTGASLCQLSWPYQLLSEEGITDDLAIMQTMGDATLLQKPKAGH